MTTANKIIEEALEVGYQEYPKTFIEKIFHIGPSESKLKNRALMYLINRIANETERANVAERRMYEGIRECLRFIEQRDPETALYIGRKYLQK